MPTAATGLGEGNHGRAGRARQSQGEGLEIAGLAMCCRCFTIRPGAVTCHKATLFDSYNLPQSLPNLLSPPDRVPSPAGSAACAPRPRGRP